MVDCGQTNFHEGWPKSTMVHYSLQYMSTWPRMRHINIVTFSFYQGLCSITMFMKVYVALQHRSRVMLHCNDAQNLIKCYVTLWHCSRVIPHCDNAQCIDEAPHGTNMYRGGPSPLNLDKSNFSKFLKF